MSLTSRMDAVALKALNPFKKRCDKCGGDNIIFSYHPARGSCTYGYKSAWDGEHLHYVCRTCSYDWTGPCADSEKRT